MLDISVLYILTVEIVALCIKYSKDINSIKNGNDNEIKMIQLAEILKILLKI